MSIIEARNLSKLYRLGATVGHDTLRDAIAHGFRSLFRRNPSLLTPHASQSSDYIWALKDVSFNVEQGGIVGIIGRNGAGKRCKVKKINIRKSGNLAL